MIHLGEITIIYATLIIVIGTIRDGKKTLYVDTKALMYDMDNQVDA